MNKVIRRTLLLGACCLVPLVSACKEDVSQPLASEDKPMSQATGSNSNSATDGTTLTQQVEAAVADLAERAGVAPSEIRVDQARMVSWGTSAMGCPRKGMEYKQVIVPGILVLLEANGRIYRYHGGMSGAPFYCPEGQAQAPALGQGAEFM